MGRRPLVQAEPEKYAPTTVPTREQLNLFAPATTRVVAASPGLIRMTWRDYVAGLHDDAKARELPAWKLRFNRGDYLLMRPTGPDALRVTALVREGTNFPADFDLPVLVQVGVYVDGKFAEDTMVPASAFEQHLDEKEIPF